MTTKRRRRPKIGPVHVTHALAARQVGHIADRLGMAAAIQVVAALTLLSALVVISRMQEPWMADGKLPHA